MRLQRAAGQRAATQGVVAGHARRWVASSAPPPRPAWCAEPTRKDRRRCQGRDDRELSCTGHGYSVGCACGYLRTPPFDLCGRAHMFQTCWRSHTSRGTTLYHNTLFYFIGSPRKTCDRRRESQTERSEKAHREIVAVWRVRRERRDT